ncbi:MAG: hypothetical protein HXX18_02835 [Bacteroidetes bacterium]|nr:hypothetical protein [Bacteroidota bacterium]
MKKNKLLTAIFIIIISNFSCYCQDSCKIEFSLHDNPIHDFTDTFKIYHSQIIDLYICNDGLFLNNKIVHKLKNVQSYDEITFFSINNKYYLYIYPVYLNQIGPYIDTFGNGILISIKKNNKINVSKRLGYYEVFNICNILKEVVKRNKNH